MSSTIDPSFPPLKPSFQPTSPDEPEKPSVQKIIDHLQLQKHIEGGYFVETDRDTLRIPNPFVLQNAKSRTSSSDILVSSRSASTTIHYFLSPSSPLGAFHRNRGRTVHTLHRGRARYVIIHADEVAASSHPGGYGHEEVEERERWVEKARVETFVVGPDVLNGEKLQWIVEGGKYKCSFLLPDDGDEEGKESEGCLISETVVPGFEYEDHDFMKRERMEALLTQEQVDEVGWMLRKDA